MERNKFYDWLISAEQAEKLRELGFDENNEQIVKLFEKSSGLIIEPSLETNETTYYKDYLENPDKYIPQRAKRTIRKSKTFIMKLIQDWGDGVNKITIEADEKDIRKAIRVVTHWTCGDMLLRFNALGTEERDRCIVKIQKYLQNDKIRVRNKETTSSVLHQ